MTITTDVVQRRKSFWDAYRRHGYFFKQAATLTISFGVVMHLYRAVFGDEMTLQNVMTPMTDKLLLIPMTYAAITGIVLWRRVEFVNKAHKVFFTWAVAYITLSVPLHVYFGVIEDDVDFYLSFFPLWFTYLLFPLYAAVLTLFAKLQYRN